MQKNLYYRNTIKRQGALTDWFLGFFNSLASPTRELLEVFIRKDFGERYFRLSSVITLTLFLIAIPFVPAFVMNSSGGSGEMDNELRHEFTEVNGKAYLLKYYLTWYIFLGCFVAVSIKHHKQIKRSPSVFDFAKYSKCSGTINPFFYKINLPFIRTDTRTIETIFEPLPFFLAGLVFMLFGQGLGYLLVFCGICYSLSYVAAYRVGDNFIMDMIDEMICNEELEKAFLGTGNKAETKGFDMVGQRPTDPELARKLMSRMVETEEVVEAR